MPTESEMEARRLALIALAEQINDEDLIIAQKRIELINKDAQVDTLDAALLLAILEERFVINNQLRYTNDDQRRVALVLARNASQPYLLLITQKNALILGKDSATSEAARLRRIYRPDELMMRYFANQPEVIQPIVTAPLTPTNFASVVISPTQINISATASNGADSYVLRRGLDANYNSFIDIPLSQPTRNDVNLSPSTEYFHKLKAVNTAGESPFTASLARTTQAAPTVAPNAPTNLVAVVVSPTQINLSWTAPTGTVTGFKVQRATNNTFTANVVEIPVTTAFYNNQSLVPGTTYFYQVLASNSAGDSPYSNSASATTQNAPTGNTVNYALASNGSTATSSSYYNGDGFAPNAIDGTRHTNSAWNSPSQSTWVSQSGFPQWIEINFNQSRSITEIHVYSLADVISYNTNPLESDISTQFTTIDFDLQRWTGSAWVDIVNVIGNNKVWRKEIFAAVTTNKIRLFITNTASTNCYVTEVEAY